MRGWRMDVVRAPRFRASERTPFSRRSSGRRAGRRARECLVRRGAALKGRLHCTEPEKMARTQFGGIPYCCYLTYLLGPGWVLTYVLRTLYGGGEGTSET